MKLTKFLLPVALLFGVALTTTNDTCCTYAEELTSEAEITSEIISEDSSEEVFEDNFSSEIIVEDNDSTTDKEQFEEKVYTYTSEEGEVVLTLISSTEIHCKLLVYETGEVIEGTAKYYIEDDLLTITKEGEDPIQFIINVDSTLLPIIEEVEEQITFFDWLIENEKMITLILTAIVVFVSALGERLMSSKGIKNTLSRANNKVDDMSNKTNESSKRLEKNVSDLSSFVKNNIGDIVDTIKQLTTEDKDFKESITKVIEEIKTEQNRISAVYTDIKNIKKSIRIAFCNDKQYYKDGRAQAIEKLLNEESGD